MNLKDNTISKDYFLQNIGTPGNDTRRFNLHDIKTDAYSLCFGFSETSVAYPTSVVM